DVDRNDHFGAERARRVKGDLGHDGAVDVEAAADLVRREIAGQRAGGKHGIGDAYVVESGQPPEHLHAGIQVYGVDNDRGVELREGEVADGPGDEVLQGLAAEQGRRPHALERHVGVGD